MITHRNLKEKVCALILSLLPRNNNVQRLFCAQISRHIPALDRALTFVNVIDSSLPRTKKANPCPLRHDGYVTTFSADIVAVLQKVSLLFVFDFMVGGLCTHSSHDIYVLFFFSSYIILNQKSMFFVTRNFYLVWRMYMTTGSV